PETRGDLALALALEPQQAHLFSGSRPLSRALVSTIRRLRGPALEQVLALRLQLDLVGVACLGALILRRSLINLGHRISNQEAPVFLVGGLEISKIKEPAPVFSARNPYNNPVAYLAIKAARVESSV